MTSDNLYTIHKSVTSIKSQVTTFELLKFGGQRISIQNLSRTIDIYQYPNGLNDLNFTYVNLSATTDSPMFFIELRLNETSVVPVLTLRPDDITANITYYIRKDRVPDQNNYDMTGSVLEDAEFEESTDSYIVKLDLSDLWTGVVTLSTNVYIGLQADYSKKCFYYGILLEFKKYFPVFDSVFILNIILLFFVL